MLLYDSQNNIYDEDKLTERNYEFWSYEKLFLFTEEFSG